MHGRASNEAKLFHDGRVDDIAFASIDVGLGDAGREEALVFEGSITIVERASRLLIDAADGTSLNGIRGFDRFSGFFDVHHEFDGRAFGGRAFLILASHIGFASASGKDGVVIENNFSHIGRINDLHNSSLGRVNAEISRDTFQRGWKIDLSAFHNNTISRRNLIVFIDDVIEFAMVGCNIRSEFQIRGERSNRARTPAAGCASVIRVNREID